MKNKSKNILPVLLLAVGLSACAGGGRERLINKRVPPSTSAPDQSDEEVSQTPEPVVDPQLGPVVIDPPVVLNPPTSSYSSNSQSLEISGTCTQGMIVDMTNSYTGSVLCVDGTFTFTYTNSVAGTYGFDLKQFDGLGNESVSVSLQWQKTVPVISVPTVLVPAQNPTTSPSSSFTISGECTTGLTVYLSGANTNSVLCEGGQYSFVDTKNVDGSYSYILKQGDSNGYYSSEIGLQWNRLSTVPPVPELVNPLSSPYYSNSANLNLVVSCVDSSVVEIGGAISESGSCVSGSKQFSLNSSTEGQTDYQIAQTDTNGMSSGLLSFSWIYDASSPALISLTSPASNPFVSSSNISIAGQCEPLAVVTLRRQGGSVIETKNCDAQGAFAMTTFDETADGIYNYELFQSDRAQNQSQVLSLQWNRNSSLSSPPVITSPSSTTTVNSDSLFVISGTCETGSVISLSGDSVSTQNCTVGNTFSFSISKSTDGTYTFSLVSQAPSALLPSNAVSRTWTRDTVAPVLSFVSQPSNPNITPTASFQIQSTEASVLYECKLNSGSFQECAGGAVSYSGLSNGSYVFVARATDTAQNQSAEISYSWTQDSYKTVALYHLEDLLDDSSNALDLENSGATYNASGKFGGAYNFAKLSSQSMSAPYSSGAFETTRNLMTIESFVKIASLPGNGVNWGIVSQSKPSSSCASNCSWALVIKGQGTKTYLSFFGSINGTTMTEVKANINITTGAWHHVAATWDRGTVKLYYNGTLVLTQVIGTAGSSTLWSSTESLVVGAWSNTNYFDGVIDEVRWSNVVRTISVPTAPHAVD